MDDATALQLEKIRNTLQTAQVAAQIQTNKHVALLAVALTVGAGAAVGGLAGQFPLEAAGVGLSGATLLLLSQLVSLAKVSSRLRDAHDEANMAIDRLMVRGGESEHDGPKAHR